MKSSTKPNETNKRPIDELLAAAQELVATWEDTNGVILRSQVQRLTKACEEVEKRLEEWQAWEQRWLPDAIKRIASAAQEKRQRRKKPV